MGFFNLLETVFFISLAITFVLIMMLVYHFKGRLILLEDKCDTMFEIMNNMVKEMKNIKSSISLPQEPFRNAMPLMHLFNGVPSFQRNDIVEHDDEEYDDEEDDDEDEDNEGNEDGNGNEEYDKIVVSDNEDDDIKVININIGQESLGEPSDAEIEAELELELEAEAAAEAEAEAEAAAEAEAEAAEEAEAEEEDNGEKKTTDYKKLHVSYLKTMVVTRGLATDTQKLKKQDLIRLLEQE